MTELSPTQVALRELMMLTKCYCGNYGEDPHPRLGHNCSFRRDVETLVGAVRRVLEMCEREKTREQPRAGHQVADEIRRALLGLPAYDGPPWSDETEPSPLVAALRELPAAAYSAQIAERLQRAEADRRLSDVEGGSSAPG